MILNIPPTNSPEEIVLGCTLKRQEEDISDFFRYKSYFREYVALGLKRYTNITFEEYLRLNTYEAKWYREMAMELAEEEKDVMNNVEKESKRKIDSIRNADGLNDLLNGDI